MAPVDGAEELVDIISGADGLVDLVELVEGEGLDGDEVPLAAGEPHVGQRLVHDLLCLARGECLGDVTHGHQTLH